MAENSQKIWFLQLSRALACLSVVYTHWYGMLVIPNAIHSLFLQDALTNYPQIYPRDYVGDFTSYIGLSYFRSGYFGLSLFFILSGYVIILSLKNSTPSDYLTRRFFRIYPTLIVCLLVAATTMMMAKVYLGSSETINLFRPKIIFSNLLLIRELLHARYIDNATWTLEIEMHFYLLIFAFFYYAREKKLETFIIAAAAMCFMSGFIFYLSQIGQGNKNLLGVARWFATNSQYLTYMFIGSTLFYMLSRQWGYRQSVTMIGYLFAINYCCLNIGDFNQGVSSYIFVNHLYAFVIFLSLYFINDWLPYSKILNKIAEVSYPFYLLHGFTGYTVYFIFYHLTTNIAFSCLSSLSLVFFISVLIHYKIEKPAIDFSKALVNNKVSLIKLTQILLKRKMNTFKISKSLGTE